MVKKKLLALGVSAVAVTAVAGAGFAGWIFDSTVNDEYNLGVHVTAAYSFGEIEIDTEPDTVVLDQAGVTLAKTGALDTAISEVTATWTVSTASYNDALSAGITYSVNVYIKDGLATYLNCGTASAESSSAKTGYTQYKVTVTPAEDDITVSGNDTVVTMTLANPFDYTEDKPDSFEAYQTMVADIKGVEASTVTTDTEYTVSATDAPVIIEFTVTKTTA